MTIGECDIAIIGMAGRFPGAPDVRVFWDNLWNGVESISSVTPRGGLVPAFGALAGIDRFDAAFFGFTPQEAERTDPQQRLFLECAWQAFEDAGYDPRAIGRPTGVFAGASLSTYLFHLISGALPMTLDAFQLLVGNDKDYLATRVAYKLGLTGPALSVQTACSTSLVAVVLACQGLLQYTIDVAIAGGVSISLPQDAGYPYEPGGILAPDGHCRAFDERAGGTVPGNGVGAVVLKRASDAIADGDAIRAIIRGFAVNNDGAAKVGYTAPSVKGQAEVIRAALATADIDPATISYVEAHGTGTALGDPVEIAALADAFGPVPERCALGSLKSNVGHLNSAAGVAALIKVCLMLEHRKLPPSLHFERPNPGLLLDRRPFRVQAVPEPWEASPRRAGVSSFGFGGTNAHVIVEEPPARVTDPRSRGTELVVLAARTRPALEEMTAQLLTFLERDPSLPLADTAYTLQVGRHPFRHRRAFIASDAASAALALRGQKRIYTGIARKPTIVFLFPGQGTQHVNMSRALYDGEPAFRDAVDASARTVRAVAGFDVLESLYPAPGCEEAAARRLEQTGVAQVALFVVELALTRLLASWGIRPDALLGHSVGELVAACVAGVLREEDALALVATRARWMQAQPPGAMLAVWAAASYIEARLPAALVVAAHNGPEQCVVSGPKDAVAAFALELAADGLRTRSLATSHAFHSPMMAPVMEPLTAAARRLAHAPPAIRTVSNVTGDFHPADRPIPPEYWAAQVRAPVRFDAGLKAVLGLTNAVLVEVGPGHALGDLAVVLPELTDQPVLSTLRGARGAERDLDILLTTLGRLWTAGAEPRWPALHAGFRRVRVSLPTYAFQRERHWVDPPSASPAAPAPALDPTAFVDVLSPEPQ